MKPGGYNSSCGHAQVPKGLDYPALFLLPNGERASGYTEESSPSRKS